TEHERAERAHQEAGSVGRKARQKRGGVVAFRKEKSGEERRQSGVEVKVVPLEDGAEGRRENDALLFGLEIRMRRRSADSCCCLSHRLPPSVACFELCVTAHLS